MTQASLNVTLWTDENAVNDHEPPQEGRLHKWNTIWKTVPKSDPRKPYQAVFDVFPPDPNQTRRVQDAIALHRGLPSRGLRLHSLHGPARLYGRRGPEGRVQRNLVESHKQYMRGNPRMQVEVLDLSRATARYIESLRLKPKPKPKPKQSDREDQAQKRFEVR
ncbi:hypothetical protein S40288_05191 [Stachybotrys chartarum IBT 40288]|nr:hypothetical protein S40288_05191 [Stachybotrys chartarum IBT 40288]